MSTHVSGGLGDFSQAAISPYAESLKDILMLVYLDTKQREKNFEMQQVGATAEGKAAKGAGDAQEAAGKEAAEAMKSQAWGEFLQGCAGMGLVLSKPLAEGLAKSQSFSLNGEEVQTMNNEIQSMKGWEEGFQEANPQIQLGDVRENAVGRNAEDQRVLRDGAGNQVGDVISDENLECRMEALRNADTTKRIEQTDKENLSLAKAERPEEFKAMRDDIRSKREKRETMVEDRQNQSKMQAFQQSTYMIQAIGMGLKGYCDGLLAAPHKEKEAEAQNLYQQSQFSYDSIKRSLDSANQVNSNIYNAQQSLIDQVMGGIARVAYSA